MATYKLIQDVEAEDKLLGPLSFRQFIYALVAVIVLYLSYFLYSHHAELLDIFTVPIALFAGFLAYPFGKDQPTEVWALAKLKFFIKPRRRIWAQSGVKELVTITVPKKVEISRTNGLSQIEVKSRLQALANTIDSRGWAIKNVNNVFQNPIINNQDSDRLISASSLPSDVPDYDIPEAQDLFDEKANPIAQQVNMMLNADTAQRRQQLIENLNNIRGNTRINNQPQIVGKVTNSVVNNLPSEEEIDQQLLKARKNSEASLNNMHSLRTKVIKTQPQQTQSTASTVVQTIKTTLSPTTSKTPDPAIINMSKRDDLKVSVISHEINKSSNTKSGPDEVSISLH